MPSPLRLSPDDCALLVVDVQERLVPAVSGGLKLVQSTAFLARWARLAGVPVLATEQYPKGLGPTVSAVAEHLSQSAESKTRFSAATPAIIKQLHRDARRTVLLAGMETHICVAQTALDLLAEDFAVALALDAVSAGRLADHQAGLDRLRQAGVVPVSVEMAVYEWMGDAAHPNFKELAVAVRARREQSDSEK
jgi:nicotinamidase-related amidase